jgi:hypothetical protein
VIPSAQIKHFDKTHKQDKDGAALIEISCKILEVNKVFDDGSAHPFYL